MRLQFLPLIAVIAGLAGCTPAGPRALLDGKHLLEQGKYPEAVEELKFAASTLNTNAQAWNYLGLAYHHAGQSAEAIEAYQHALKLDHDLVAVHYNLGCLLLELNRPDTLPAACNELTAYNVRQGNSSDGWIKLGTAQLHLGELALAETSFREAFRLNPQNVEALNDLGIVQMQRRHWRDAVTYFNNALKQQPNYAPALLNVAIAEIYLSNRALALQRYQEYLALNPRPANWEAVNAAAQQLDQEINPAPRPLPTNNIATVTNVPARTIIPPTNNSRSETVVNVPRPFPVAQSRTPLLPPSTSNPATPVKPEVVTLPDAPAVKVANDSDTMGDSADTTTPVKPAKRGFFQRLNPANLFRHDPKRPVATPLPPVASGSNTGTPNNSDTPVKPAPQPIAIARYPYISDARPEAGNRPEADRLVARGTEAQRDGRLKDAVGLFHQATASDPADFDAQARLGAAAFDLGDLSQSLRAYEVALMINPDSFDARFNFGLALKKANYIYDAAQELERLLASSAGESTAHRALVHLTLGNLYAEQFHQTAPARSHYQKVLELDPQNSQATSIRYWLQNNS